MTNNPSTKSASTTSMRTTLMPVIVLVSICAVAGILLGFVYSATAPIAAQAAYERQQETYRTLVPDASSFTEVESNVENCTALVQAVDETESPLAHVVIAEAKGYSGAVPIAVAFDEQGNVSAIQAMRNDETPGLGTRIAEEDFIGQFVNRAPESIDSGAGEIDTISGATISSNAVIEAFNTAVQAYKEVA